MNPGDRVICVNSDGLDFSWPHLTRGQHYTVIAVRGGIWPAVSVEPFGAERFWKIERFQLVNNPLSPRSNERSQTNSVQSSLSVRESAIADEAGENL